MSEVNIYRADQLSLSLTPAVQKHLKKYLSTKPAAIGVEFTLDKTGCSGYAYVVNVVESEPEQHAHCTIESITIYVPQQYLSAFQGVEVDYVKEGLNEKFIFNNPNEGGRCGCGESVSFSD